MPAISPPARPERRKALWLLRNAATLLFLADAAAALPFALGLALAVQNLISEQWDGIFLGALLVALSGPLRATVQARAAAAGVALASKTKARTRAQLYPRLLATGWAQGRLAGAEAATAVSQVEALEGLEARYRPLRTTAAIAPLLIAAVVALASPVAALILVATLVPFAIGMALAGTAARVAAERQLESLSMLTGLFVDRVRALPVILHFGAAPRLATQLEAATREVAERTLSTLRIAFVSGGIIEFFAALSVAMVAVYCGFQLLGILPFHVPETLTLPEAFFALALAGEFYLPFRRLAAAYHDRQVGEAAEAAIAARLEGPPPVKFAPQRDFGGLVARKLEVAPAPGARVGPVDLEIGRTGLVALTGPTGAGKSSILFALAGLLPPAAGALALDGGDWPEAGLLGRAAWAGQAVQLFPGTLASNIAAGRDGATEGEVRAAAEAAGLGPLLARRGGDLVIDARGSGLSGGERRRIGLARALLTDAPVLLLDEPTADLDRDAATAVITRLRAEAQQRAVIVATHDPHLIAAAEQVVALG
ncbi:ABC transporter ATP-binding protein/permease [Thermaurantiacus sp.]